ncbi:MAG: hypothetical protein PeribacterA2_0201 [Candidatus Peribacter riflensis]|uniref:Uncharacterized protein n=1 Tax=Candidatus Peribacter riflensis TaxID=1735162 RepID=A0A0S1SJA7_9BACT|nr:MAG: hypothetical protein PeribacterA2_0201 [Candidatus Peribacter riflensis]ALM10697.1 MAG: hypothetical protein PeribacterB2_0201 [Candidatus Peribacter riflensis]ALM11799.1 MAG: hypothetical protein PeribacterC2_0200 [Candidatus Peribacter riflensis]ALM12902.1 MAG: hypothetical protein PeribacterD1_0201 [Candidatus Peribacter riflensis]ALM14003.1 MAG: hypothetical protein PeribacterD2_0201 [Candidatus Peribacter riflensis]
MVSSACLAVARKRRLGRTMTLTNLPHFDQASPRLRPAGMAQCDKFSVSNIFPNK